MEWPGPPLSVVSLGCGSLSSLSSAASGAIAQADILLGAPHHFAEIAALRHQGEKINYPSPLSKRDKWDELRVLLHRHRHQRIAVLASGDALFFGVGAALNDLLERAHLRFYANISSVQAGFHRIGMPWQEADVVSLHGRPLSTLRRHLRHGQTLALLTDQQSNPAAIAAELCTQGFADSTVWLCEAMGSTAEKITLFRAHELRQHATPCHPLNICIVQLSGVATTLPSFPGIADHLFATGAPPGSGMISKREVRLSILSLMQPSPTECAWDLGAGCGSVSVEWARWNPQGHIYAVEASAARAEHIRANSARFGTVQNVHCIVGTAPQICHSLPPPDSIFIGGSQGLLTLLEYAWQRLKPGGKLVASAVTAGSQQALRDFYQGRANREWVELQVTKNWPDSDDEHRLALVMLAKCTKP